MRDVQRYAFACHRAAQRQGLAEPWRILDNHGIVVTLEQAGGFCMVLDVPCSDGRRILVTCDGEWDEFLVGHYDEPFDDAHEYRSVTADELVSAVLEWQAVQHFEPPNPDDVLSFDEVEAAGLDGALRSTL